MIRAENLKNTLCRTFCASISVNPVAAGFAVSTHFADSSGDPIGFYVVRTEDGFRIEDDGEYLSRLIASGIPIEQGSRGQILRAILHAGGAELDEDTLEIRSGVVGERELGSRLIDFLSALIRMRDLELITRDAVRSTFREDVSVALRQLFGKVAAFIDNQAVADEFAEFPADLVVLPESINSLRGAIYFVTSNDKLNEALLLKMEAERLHCSNFATIALIENADLRGISRRKFQRAQNRSLPMPIYRGDENAAMRRIGEELRLPP